MASFDYAGEIDKLLEYWDEFHIEYMDLVPRYKALIEKKRALGLKLNDSKSVTNIKEFPSLRFLEIEKRKTAEYVIDDMTPTQIRRLVTRIEEEVINSSSPYQRIRKMIKFHQADIEDQLRPKSFTTKLRKNS